MRPYLNSYVTTNESSLFRAWRERSVPFVQTANIDPCMWDQYDKLIVVMRQISCITFESEQNIVR